MAADPKPIRPHQNGVITCVMLGGKNLDAAFEDFRKNWWHPATTGAIGVGHNSALVARVIPVCDPEKEENEPRLELWP